MLFSFVVSIFTIPIVIYSKFGEIRKDSWIYYLHRRIYRDNSSNLIQLIGETGSGKSWSGLSVCEKLSKLSKVPFTIDHVVFGFEELMELINSDKCPKGTSILFEEAQVSISNRNWMSQASKVFNYFLSTMRHRNLTLIFTTPYEDLLDKSLRKLFHFKFLTAGIDKNEKVCRLKAFKLQYNSQIGKFFEHYLRVRFKPTLDGKPKTTALKVWKVTKPSDDLIKVYEKKKLAFTTQLNKNILAEFKSNNVEEKEAKYKKTLTNFQQDILELYKQGITSTGEIAKKLDRKGTRVSENIGYIIRKGYNLNKYKKIA